MKNAEDIRIIVDEGYSFPADNLEYNPAETLVAAMAIWHVSQQIVTLDGVKVAKFQVSYCRVAT